MKKYLAFCLILFGFLTTCRAQEEVSPYAHLWQMVHQHELKELPKSALLVVDTIYARAKREKNNTQSIKALIYKSKFMLSLQEEAHWAIVNNFQEEIRNAGFPAKNVLENMLANILWQYYQARGEEFYRRSQLSSKNDARDFRTWDLHTLFSEIHFLFQASLQNRPALQKINIEDFEDLLLIEEQSKKIRPTLYDVLAHNALIFYEAGESKLHQPIYRFEIDKAQYFTDFSGPVPTKDSLSPHYNALLIYDQLLSLHKDTPDPTAFVTVELQRLSYIRKNATLWNKNDLYFSALQDLAKKYQGHPVSAAVNFYTANYFYEQGQKYQEQKDPIYQFEKKKALRLSEEVIREYPETESAQKLALLIKTIKEKEMILMAEKFIPINTPSRLLIEYQNMDSLGLKIFKLSQQEKAQLQNIHIDLVEWAFIEKLPLVKDWQNSLPNEQDYQNHSTEVVLPPLPSGLYVICATNQIEAGQDVKPFGYNYFQVTNFALNQTSNGRNHLFQVIERNTGKPIEGASVWVKGIGDNRKPLIWRQTSDKDGTISLAPDYYANTKVTVSFQGDSAVFGEYYLFNRKKDKGKGNRKIPVKAFLFADRSIYRPGQKVYFKGILVKKQKEEQLIVIGEFVEVSLLNVNREMVARQRLKTNEFGSFSGEFTLPAAGLTGDFQIEVKEDLSEESTFYKEEMDHFGHSGIKIKVEEYKRPKFKTDFSEIKKSYRLNDTIQVRGSAMAFEGSRVSNAQVTYRVHRKVHYPHWYSWGRPSWGRPSWGRSYHQNISVPQEIAFGETVTDEHGAFFIDFKAIPDKKIAKESYPVFLYEVTADVTDVNGETRSATTRVSVGYHAMVAKIEAQDRMDKSRPGNEIEVRTENLNGEVVTATGTLKMYKLKAPENVLRQRSWRAPDYQQIPEAAFKNLFPHDPYRTENEVESRPKGKMVWQSSFNTANSGGLKLPEMGSWESGYYIIELDSQDKFGQQVKDQKLVYLFSEKDNTVADKALFTFQTEKQTYKAGEKIRLKMGTASEELWVTLQIEKNKEALQTMVVPLRNSIETIELPLKNRGPGIIAIHYSFAAYNSYEKGSLLVEVKEEEETLEIETLSFRDKMQAGSPQRWSFKIKGEKGNKAIAEIMAAMYDASLDQFHPHSWHFSPDSEKGYYPTIVNDGNGSFGNIHFFLTTPGYFHLEDQLYGHFAQWDWFGFNLYSPSFFQKKYLHRIAFEEFFSTSFEVKIDENRKKGLVYGKIVDKESGAPLAGARVSSMFTSKTAYTDKNGNYSIKAQAGDALTFGYVGMQRIRIPVEKYNVINIKMSPELGALEELVVEADGTQKVRVMTNAASTVGMPAVEMMMVEEKSTVDRTVNIRGTSSGTVNGSPVYIIDGELVVAHHLKQEDILSLKVLSASEATALYGARAASGAIIITTKEGKKKLEAELAGVQTRRHFQETAFFYPHLSTDKNGDIIFGFTAPEALTQWKLQLLAHTKNLLTTSKTLYSVTQKDLMVIPNPPRYLRVGDEIVFSSKIANLTGIQLKGTAALQLFDAESGEPVDGQLGNIHQHKPFTIDAKGNVQVSWQLKVPDGVPSIQYKVVAKAGSFSDGEQNALLVLPNRMLVTETLPFHARSNQQKSFTLDKLKNNSSSSLKHHQLILEMTSNPVWYAVQALPYLMEYPYECSEQTFARYYANTLASHIVHANPKIIEVFKQWKSSDALLSKLEKNEELKKMAIRETPWLRDAENESAQKKRLALLFDLNKMSSEGAANLHKLKQLQLSDGGFPWFKGSPYPNRFITQHIATSFGHLQHLGLDTDNNAAHLISGALHYLDQELVSDYTHLLKVARNLKAGAATTPHGVQSEEEYLKKNHIGPLQVQYLYMNSFFPGRNLSREVKEATHYFLRQSAQYWKEQPLYMKGMIALAQHRGGNKTIALEILNSLEEYSINSEELGMYWKENIGGWGWHQSAVETQALMIEVFSEIDRPSISAEKKNQQIDALKVWLLKNKQNKQWPSTKATTEAVYALLIHGTDFLSQTNLVDVTVGRHELKPSEKEKGSVEAGTGYFKTNWKGGEIDPAMGRVTISANENEVVWGALYWQYFEDLDKISSSETPLKLSKKIFLKKNTETGEVLFPVDGQQLKVGDLLRVRVELKADRDMEFLHMKDMRASGLEPVNVLSEYKWQGGLGYYESTRDASTNFFFDRLPKGIYVFEYDVRVNNQGEFSNGITTIQSMYAPEFSSHSQGTRLKVAE